MYKTRWSTLRNIPAEAPCEGNDHVNTSLPSHIVDLVKPGLVKLGTNTAPPPLGPTRNVKATKLSSDASLPTRITYSILEFWVQGLGIGLYTSKVMSLRFKV